MNVNVLPPPSNEDGMTRDFEGMDSVSFKPNRGASTASIIAAVLASTACEPAVRGGAVDDGGAGAESAHGALGDGSAGDCDSVSGSGSDGTGGGGSVVGSGGAGGSTGESGGSLGGGGAGGSTGEGGGSVGGGGAGGSIGDGGSGGAGGSVPGTCVPGSVLACYSGPTGTVGIGACETGTQTCRSDGLGYGPCTGDVTPVAERCVTPVDESCDGVPHCPRFPPWARGYGGPGQDNGLSIVSDASGNYYVSGDFEGTIDFGAGPLTSAGESDIFLLKLDPSGSVIWSRRFGTEFEDESATMTIDASGNIFLAGLYGGYVYPWEPGPDFGGNPITAAEGAALFMVQFDPEGNHIWSNGFQAGISGAFPGKVAQVAVDGAGNAYVLYSLTDHTYTLHDTTYLAKVSTGGVALSWRETLSGDVVNGAASLAIDSAGNVLVANESPTTELHPGPLELTVSKFAPTGVLLWRRSFASSSTDGSAVAAAASVVVDAADEVVVTAFTDGTIDFGGGVLPEGPVLVKLDAAGQHFLSRSVRFGDKISLDHAGGLFAAGHGLAKLDASGTELWSVDFDPLVEDVAISPNGTVAITGSMLGPVDFGTGPIPYTADRDVFVATFNHVCDDGEGDCEAAGGGGAGGSSGEGGGGGMPGSCTPGSVLVCYTGPAGTVGIGACETGTQTCRSDGLGYGPCTGDVTPAAERCATPVDESCDGVPHCPRLPPWARGYGGPDYDSGRSIVSDASGNYYVSGDFVGTVDFGAGPLTSAGGSDIFLLKLDPAGAVIWNRRFGTEFYDGSATMTVDGSGNIFLTGVYGGDLMPFKPGPDFGGGRIPPAEGSALFAAQLDLEGNHVWSNGFFVGVPVFTPWRVQRTVVDGAGNVYMLYLIEEYYHLAKVSAGGAALLWTIGLPGYYGHEGGGGGLAVDSAGNVLVSTGTFYNGMNLGWGDFTVSKFDPAGALLWRREFASRSLDPLQWAYSLAVNAADEVLVTGITDGTVDFGDGESLTTVLLKLDAAGGVVFSRSVPFYERILLDPSGGMFVAGAGGLAKLDESGTELWSVDFEPLAGTFSKITVEDIVLSPNGTVAIVGSTYTPVDFGTGPIPYAGRDDIFVATFNP
ncbi:hypothetical protein [Sorangium sp. So ce128]|uniref:hypothetical protein n=1 Tax=Sorangium sp. So ce128 TaxID=3133281 RepID=UPI003F5EC67B